VLDALLRLSIEEDGSNAASVAQGFDEPKVRRVRRWRTVPSTSSARPPGVPISQRA
jgi:hypothetical protein